MRGRDIYVISWLVLLFFVSWFVALGRLIGLHFWDAKYNLEKAEEHPTEELFYNSTATTEISKSYFTQRRYVYFLPHVVCAILWWNLYFFQLIPSIRKRFRSTHRYLGRFLMVVVLIQAWSGFGLAVTSHSSIIKIVSCIFAAAVFYCVYKAWRHAAIYKDIPRHKFWVMRLVGYLQTIALQRFWLMFVIISHQSGWTGLYPAITDDTSDEDIRTLVLRMFDDSFVISILHAILTTEWYLSLEMGVSDVVQPGASASPATQQSAIGTDSNPQGSTTYSSFSDNAKASSQQPRRDEAQSLL